MSDAFIIAAGLCIAAGGVADFLKIPLESKRRIYWAASFLAAVCIFFAAYPDLKKLLGMLVVISLVTVGWAYAHTPYIKINGRIYAFQPIHINAESKDAPAKLHRHEQIATAAKIWWVIAGFALAFDVALCSSFLPGRERLNFHDARELLLYLLGFYILFSVGFGYGEAKFGYPVAQRQRLQFVIASVSSAGLFAVLYLASYRLTSLAYARQIGRAHV